MPGVPAVAYCGKRAVLVWGLVCLSVCLVMIAVLCGATSLAVYFIACLQTA